MCIQYLCFTFQAQVGNPSLMKWPSFSELLIPVRQGATTARCWMLNGALCRRPSQSALLLSECSCLHPLFQQSLNCRSCRGLECTRVPTLLQSYPHVKPCGDALWLLPVRAFCRAGAENEMDLPGHALPRLVSSLTQATPAEYSSSNRCRIVPFSAGGKPILGLGANFMEATH